MKRAGLGESENFVDDQILFRSWGFRDDAKLYDVCRIHETIYVHR